jgi:hypothetical protein
MTIQYGYYVDTTGIKLADAGADGLSYTWVHALPVGEYSHPVHGKLSFTPDRIKRFADSVAKRIRGIDPDIDYDHKTDPAKGHQAAGWVKNAAARDDGLWLQVGFTPTATTELKEKKFRYFSADFHDKWIDPKGVEHQDVLAGGALTNRPYLKDLMPVNLSELTFSEPTKKEGAMDYAKLRGLLHLPDNTTDEAVDAALENRLTVQQPAPPQHDPNNPPNPAPWSPPPAGNPQPENPFRDKQLTELATQLGENHPAILMLKATQQAQETQAKQLAELNTAIKLSETNRKLSEIQQKATSKNIAIAPAVLDEAKAVLLAAPDAVATQLYGVLEKLAGGDGVVRLGEQGGTSQDPNARTGASDPFEAFDQRARKLMEADKGLTFSDAIEQAIRENPTAYAEYRKQSYLSE